MKLDDRILKLLDLRRLQDYINNEDMEGVNRVIMQNIPYYEYSVIFDFYKLMCETGQDWIIKDNVEFFHQVAFEGISDYIMGITNNNGIIEFHFELLDRSSIYLNINMLDSKNIYKRYQGVCVIKDNPDIKNDYNNLMSEIDRFINTNTQINLNWWKL